MIRKRTNDRSSNRPRPSILWQKCTTFRSLKQIHASLIVKGFNSDPSSLRELIFSASMVALDAINYAYQLFDEISQPDIFMWNTVIRGSTQSCKPLKAVSLYTQMEKLGGKPDSYTFPFLLKACTMLEWEKTGFCVHGKVLRYGFGEDRFVRNTLIYFHANCGDLGIARAIFEGFTTRDVVPWSALTAGYARRGELDEARKLFDEMPVKDLISWNVMITGYAKRGEMESARRLFDDVSKRDVVTWNAMISGYVLCGKNREALEMFEEMRSVGEQPDEVTLLNLLSACRALGDLEVGMKVHCLLLEMGRGSLSLLSGNALIDMYAKGGDIEQAREVFRGMKERDVSTWNSLIVGLAFHGHDGDSIQAFEKMRKLKYVRPNDVTFLGVLVACSHSGRVEEGRQYFDLMMEHYGIEPNIRHYGCMVDMLGRVGLLSEAYQVIEEMKVEPNSIIWRTLLGACRIYGNVELARCASERLLKMRQESGDYVLLSHVYASIGEWDGAEKVRQLMDESGVIKGPGLSLIEADDYGQLEFLLDSKAKFKNPYNEEHNQVRLRAKMGLLTSGDCLNVFLQYDH